MTVTPIWVPKFKQHLETLDGPGTFTLCTVSRTKIPILKELSQDDEHEHEHELENELEPEHESLKKEKGSYNDEENTAILDSDAVLASPTQDPATETAGEMTLLTPDNTLLMVPPQHEALVGHKKKLTLAGYSEEIQPRARTCVMRGWLFNDSSTGVIISTTDKRSAKFQQIASSSSAAGAASGYDSTASLPDDLSYNAPYEAVFYLPHHNRQYRFRGRILILDNDPSNSSSNTHQDTHIHDRPSRPVHSSSQSHGRKWDNQPAGRKPASAIPSSSSTTRQSTSRSSSSSSSSLSSSSSSSPDTLHYDTHPPKEFYAQPPKGTTWQDEYIRVWNTLSRRMQDSFLGPPPGKKLSEYDRQLLDAVDRGVSGGGQDEALSNFVVLLLHVDRVDFVECEGPGKRFITVRLNDDDWALRSVCP